MCLWSWQRNSLLTLTTETDNLVLMSKDSVPRLIFASSEQSAEMLYATEFFVPDPFLFLQMYGTKKMMPSDWEIDRGQKEAKVDEVVSLLEIEAPLEKKHKGKPPIEQTIA